MNGISKAVIALLLACVVAATVAQLKPLIGKNGWTNTSRAAGRSGEASHSFATSGRRAIFLSFVSALMPRDA
jgi:hypothetical protein